MELVRRPVERESKPRKKRSPLKRAQDRLWKAFSAFVKERDGNVCFSCGKGGLQGKGWHAGHMFPAGSAAVLRWHPLNVHSQCYHCNIDLGSNGAAYASRFIEVYGIDQFSYLNEIKHRQMQWREPDIRELIEALKKSGADYELLYLEKIGPVLVPSHADSSSKTAASQAVNTGQSQSIDINALPESIVVTPPSAVIPRKAIERMSPELLYVRDQKLAGSDLRAAMKSEGISMREAAALFDVSLKTMYNLVRSEQLRGPYRWAAYALFPALRPALANSGAE